MIEIAAVDPSPAAVITCARGFAAFPAAQTPVALVFPALSTRTKPRSSGVAAELLQEATGARTDLGPDEEGGSLNGSTIAEHHSPEAIVFDNESSNLAVDDADVACFELRALRLREVVGVRKEDQVVRPLTNELCMVNRVGVCAEHAQGLISNFPAVAVGAVEEVLSPALLESGDRRELICCAGCD